MNEIKINLRRNFKLVNNGDLTQNLHSLVFQNSLLISEVDLGKIEDILIDNKQLKEKVKRIEQPESNWKELKKWLEEELYSIKPKGTEINFNCEYDSEEDYIRAMKKQSKLLTLEETLKKIEELENDNNE